MPTIIVSIVDARQVDDETLLGAVTPPQNITLAGLKRMAPGCARAATTVSLYGRLTEYLLTKKLDEARHPPPPCPSLLPAPAPSASASAPSRRPAPCPLPPSHLGVQSARGRLPAARQGVLGMESLAWPHGRANFEVESNLLCVVYEPLYRDSCNSGGLTPAVGCERPQCEPPLPTVECETAKKSNKM